MKYINTKNKLQSIWKNNKNVIRDLSNKENEITQFFMDKNNLQKIKTLYDSGWVATTPTASSAVRNATPGELLPERVLLNSYYDFNIPEHFLPFVNVSVMTKTVPEVSFLGVFPFTVEGYDNDYIEVKGNGSNLIYAGYPRSVYYEYDESDLADEMFQESYTKKVYRAVIYYTSGGNEYKVDGRLIKTTVRENGSVVGGNQEYDEWQVRIDSGYTGYLNYSEYHNLDETEIDCTARKREVRYNVNPSPPPDYLQQVTLDDNGGAGYRVTKNWSSVDREYHLIKNATLYKKIDGSWANQGTGDYTIDTLSGHVITERSFQFVGYWLFYSSTRNTLFGTQEVSPTVEEGIYNKIELANLPEDADRIWTTITLKRNPEPRPEKTQAVSYYASSQRIINFKRFEDKYRLYLQGYLVFSAPSTVINPPPAEKTSGDHRQVPEYNDTYSQNATSYTASESHTLKNRDFWGTAKQDLEYRIKIDIINPFYWKELKNYDV